MDYLDPKKRFRQQLLLYTGYILIGIAIIIGTIILLYQAYGFGLDKRGAVIQNGLFFFSSQPHPATIYANGKLQPVKTNTRLSLPAGIYNIVLKRDGYRDWQRNITLDGGSVQHVDYPFLFPKTLSSKKVQTYAAAPGLTTQSPDRRWLLVQQANTLSSFDIYDLKDPTKAPVSLTLPANLLTKAETSESWQLGEWADDNRHILLRHIYDDKTEFVLIDRTTPAESVNLNAILSTDPTKLTLKNKKYDQYFVYAADNKSLQTFSLKATTPQPLLDHVLDYQSYKDDTILYVTDSGAPAGKALLKLQSGSKIVTVRSLPAGTDYLLDLTGYSSDLYVVAGASSENKVYIYKDPAGQLAANPGRAAVPSQILHVTAPNYVSFSDSAQLIVAENGSEFGVYDIENELAYHYTVSQPLDAPQPHANWMDGDRLLYISKGKTIIIDYDNANQQVLGAGDPKYEPFFTPNFKFLYSLTPADDSGQLNLAQTSLLTPADQ